MKKIFIFAAVFFISISAFGEERLKWPEIKTDLPFDQSIKFNRLDNGFRYLIKTNNTPEKRAALYLGVMAGSIHETEEERGIAHFLEHMVFCGSKNFSPGELVNYFQKIGMDFGADTNAHTGFDETVYKIYLPEGKKEELKEGLIILNDFAFNALIPEKEVERERKVVLAEMSARDSADYRTRVKLYNFLFDGLILPKRFPIGEKSVLESSGPENLKKFYNSMYTPERMVLAVVGDLDLDETEKLIKEVFSEKKKTNVFKEISDFGKLKNKKGIQTFYHYEKESASTSVSINFIKDIESKTSNFLYESSWLKKYMVSLLLNYRLNSLLEKSDQPFESANTFTFPFMNRVLWSNISGKTSPENWEKTLLILGLELKKIKENGFYQYELERVKNEVIKIFERGVETSKTRDTKELAASYISSAMGGEIIVSPENEQKIFSPFVKNLTLEDLNKSFDKIWDLDNLSIALTGNVLIKDKPLEKISQSAKKAFLQKTKEKNEKTAKVFPYLEISEQKSGIKEKLVLEPEVKRIILKNNNIINYKKTDFDKNKVFFKASFGRGKAFESENKKGLYLLSSRVLNSGKLSSISSEELGISLSNKDVFLKFGVDEDRLYFTGSSSKNDLETLFLLFYHYINDPGIKENAYELSLKRLKTSYEKKLKSVDGNLSLNASGFFAENDHRFEFLTYEDAKKISIHDIKQLINDNFKNQAFEVSIVGDFDEEVIENLSLKYLGVDKKRSKIKQLSPKPVGFPMGKNKEIFVDTKIESAFVLGGFKTDHIYPIENSRALSLCARIIDDRLRVNIRENLGLAYSPFAYNQPSKVYENYGGLFMGVKTSPEKTEIVKKEIKNIISSLKNKKITDDEFERALKPLLSSIATQVQQNSYWLNTVLDGSFQNKVQLEWAKTIVSDYSSLTKEVVQEKCDQYLLKENISFLIIKSKKED
ncbi:MAG: insulinase family protein [Desulforegulaceae bacterium]|nr:insulinase family protein [Desulforegulaceae bacterium]